MRAASTQGSCLDTQSERSQTGIIRRHIARLVVGILALGCSVAEAHNRPTGLMTDMVTDAGMLCRSGRRIAETMSDIAEQDFAGCQFAAVRSSRPTFGWIVPDCGRGTHQLSYRIIVSVS